MHFRKDELLLIYNAENARDRQTLAYALGITSKINRQEINSVRVSPSLFVYAVQKLGWDVKRLLNKADVEYQHHHRGHEYPIKMWFEAIRKRPSLLRAPIAILGDNAVVCDSPTDVMKLLRVSTTIPAA